MFETQDSNKNIDDFLLEAEPSSKDIAIKISIIFFLAITSVYFVREAYEQYQLHQLASSQKRNAQSFGLQMDRLHASKEQLNTLKLENQKRPRKIKAHHAIKENKRVDTAFK